MKKFNNVRYKFVFLCFRNKIINMSDSIEQQLVIYNTLTRKKEVFEPLHPPHVVDPPYMEIPIWVMQDRQSLSICCSDISNSSDIRCVMYATLPM